MRLSANLGFLFPELPFAERFAAAAAAGFRGVECMYPGDDDADAIAGELQRHQLELVLFNLPAGDWAGGERGIGCLPGREAEFREGAERALQLAKKLGTRRLNALAGIAPAGVDEHELAATYAANLRHVAERAAGAGVRLLVEPINSRIDMPGFWLDTPAKAMAMLDRVAHPGLGLQFDVYHAAVMTGRPLETLQACFPRVEHVQIADHPGRHEPGTGSIDYPAILHWLDAAGYDGWVGCEYRPSAGAGAAAGWAGVWLGRGAN